MAATAGRRDLTPEPVVKRILIVEDNELNRDVLSRLLARRGYDVVLATEGVGGLDAAVRTAPDLILMDLGMPEMDGWECARLLKDAERTASIPIIALTAHAMLGERRKALDAGCDDFDTKPINFARLLQKIEGLLHARPAPALS
jgi:two-component system, cell cycle response regulator DivK